MSKKTTFTNLADLEKYIKNQFASTIWMNQGIKEVIADEMSQAVEDIVYTAHEPETYKRRKNNDGLSDVRNVEITYIKPVNEGVYVVIENLTEGNDSLEGQFITDLIEEGGTTGWDDPYGVWTEPRPFVEVTVNRIKANPTRLTDEVKKSLRAIGLNVK